MKSRKLLPLIIISCLGLAVSACTQTTTTGNNSLIPAQGSVTTIIKDGITYEIANLQQYDANKEISTNLGDVKITKAQNVELSDTDAAYCKEEILKLAENQQQYNVNDGNELEVNITEWEDKSDPQKSAKARLTLRDADGTVLAIADLTAYENSDSNINTTNWLNAFVDAVYNSSNTMRPRLPRSL